MLDFIGYTLAAIAILTRVVAAVASSAMLILIILAFCGVIGWSLVLIVFLSGVAAGIISFVAMVSADAILS